MGIRRVFKTSMMAVPLLAVQLGAAWPCGFHGGLGNTFQPMHPKSIGVALAVRDAVVAGLVEPPVDPVQAGRAGYWRAVGHLKGLQRALSSGNYESLTPVSILFIDSGLWARLTPSSDGLAMDVHTEGAKDGDVVIVTSEPVLAAVLDSRLPATAAFHRELIVIDGPGETLTQQLLLKGLTSQESKELPRTHQPVRLFGPSLAR